MNQIKDDFNYVGDSPAPLPEKIELTEMQKFVVTFMQTRKKQDSKFCGNKLTAFYCQNARYAKLKTFIIENFSGTGLMKKSEMFDFMIYLLEGYLAGSYGGYETFNSYYEREMGKIEITGLE